jgi:hypothetical protein
MVVSAGHGHLGGALRVCPDRGAVARVVRRLGVVEERDVLVAEIHQVPHGFARHLVEVDVDVS